MKRLSFLFVFIVIVLPGLKAQDELVEAKWKTGGMGAIMVNQLSLTNWSAGGQNSISLNTLGNLFANYKSEKANWDNTIDLAYGILKSEGESTKKSDDKIDLASKFGYITSSEHWFYSALLSFKSQFAQGYKYPNDSVYISKFMAPGYLLLSAGMDYKPIDNFSLVLAPLTGKVTFVRDQTLANAGAFGVEKAEFDTSGNVVTSGRMIREEFGGFIKLAYNKDLMENVNLQTKLELFSNYIKEPQNVDVNWELLVGMKVNKYISVNLSTQLIYDHDIAITDKNGNTGPRTQFKELIGVGFSYKF